MEVPPTLHPSGPGVRGSRLEPDALWQVLAVGAVPFEDLRKCITQEEIFVPLQARALPADPAPTHRCAPRAACATNSMDVTPAMHDSLGAG